MIIQTLIFPLILSISQLSGVKEVDFVDAVEQKLISCEATSKGFYSGDCMRLSFKNLSKDKLVIKIQPGTHFLSNNEHEQDILVVEEQEMILAKNDQGVQTVEGFCSQQSNHSPDKGSGYSITKTKEKKYQEIADLISGKGISLENKQEAVWAIEAGEGVAHIIPSSKSDDATIALREQIAQMNNEQNVWYEQPREITVSETRQIIAQPIKVNGKVETEVKTKGKLDCRLLSPSGSKMYDIMKDAEVPVADRFSFEFDVEVRGWPEGTYTIEVLIDNNRVHTQEFKV